MCRVWPSVDCTGQTRTRCPVKIYTFDRTDDKGDNALISLPAGKVDKPTESRVKLTKFH